MATAVPNTSFWVCSAISAPGRNGSCIVSVDQRAEKPISCAARAMEGTRESETGGRVASNKRGKEDGDILGPVNGLNSGLVSRASSAQQICAHPVCGCQQGL